MAKRKLFDEIIEDVGKIARREAKGKPPRVILSPEVAGRLKGIGPKDDLFNGTTDAVPPTAPASAQPPTAHVPDPGDPNDSLDRIAGEVRVCRKCGLCNLRTNAVPGEGNGNADLVFVGEAPGADEDRQGRPFVGRAGLLLTDIIVKGMKLQREDVFICNVLKCRPPENRTPNPEEVFCCEPYLIRQLALIKPKVICALGGTAAQTLLKTSTLVGQLRGRWHNYHDIPLRVTYHPAYLLRNPADKKKAWEDIQEVMRLMAGEIPPPV